MSEFGRAALKGRRGKNGVRCCYRNIYEKFDVWRKEVDSLLLVLK